MSNIAEGFESRTQGLFIEYLGCAKASAGEVRSQLYVALDRRYISQGAFDHAVAEVEICSRQLTRFIHYLEGRSDARRIREESVAYDV